MLIDSYQDKRTAYEFAVNPSGVKLDRYWYNDNNRDDSWDAVWDVSVSRDAQGWRNVFLSPFHRQMEMSEKQREEFARYSAINMPMKVEEVPPDLRF